MRPLENCYFGCENSVGTGSYLSLLHPSSVMNSRLPHHGTWLRERYALSIQPSRRNQSATEGFNKTGKTKETVVLTSKLELFTRKLSEW